MRNLLAANLFVVLWACWRRRYLIAAPIIAMPIVGLIIGAVSPKKYESYTTILIQEAAKQNPFLEDFTVATNLRDRMEALNALLHSRHVLGEVVHALPSDTGEHPSSAETDRMVVRLSRSLRATLVGDDLVQIRYVSERPEGMIEVLEVVTEKFVERIVAPQRSSVRNSEAFLRAELESRRVELERAERELAEYKTIHASELPELHSTNVIRLGELRQLLAERRAGLEGARAALDTLTRRLARTNPVAGKIEESIISTRGDLAALRARYTENHSAVRAAARRLDHLEVELAQSLDASDRARVDDIDWLWNMASLAVAGTGASGPSPLAAQLDKFHAADARVRGLEREVPALRAEVEDLRNKVAGYGEHERRLTEIQRDLNIKRELYEDLARRHQLARVTDSLGTFEEEERVKIIDQPFTPLEPSNLSTFIYVLAGLLAGGALGAGLAVIAELLDSTVRRRDVLERLIGAPTLARIPVLPNDGFVDGTGLDRTVSNAAAKTRG